jgi:sucrose phosphorylase
MFLTFDKVFPDGAKEADLTKIYRPRPGLPFTSARLKDDTKKLVWTTFTSNQIDIDVYSDPGKEYLDNILNTFELAGIKMIRLDAAGYAVKRKGTSCFMIDETFDFIASFTKKAQTRGIEVLVEIHSHYKTQIKIAKKVDYVYDFALPVLVLDTLFNKNSASLKRWLEISPGNVFTVLDTHDGIGIIDVASEGDKPGLIANDVLNTIVNTIHMNSGKESLKATGTAASNLDLYQVNCTYYDALARDDFGYLIARAIQFFVPGIPQVYYVGLFAGENDMDLLAKTNVGRDINRHYYTKKEIKNNLDRPLIIKLKEIMQFRNEHPAFNGTFSLIQTSDDIINIKWTLKNEWTELYIDLTHKKMKIEFSTLKGATAISFDNYSNAGNL